VGRTARLWLAAGLFGFAGLAAAGEGPVCASAGVSRLDAAGLVEQAVEVLRACGYDPRDFRVTLRRERLADTGTHPDTGIAVVFEPLDPAGRHSLAVWPSEPCVVGWLPGASTMTAWQREALERVRSHVRDIAPEWIGRDDWNLRVTETRRRIGFRLSTVDGAGGLSEFRVLLRKADLSVLASGESVRLEE